MNPKERLFAILDRKPVDRLPVDLWHTPEIGQALRQHFGVDGDLAVYRELGLDKIVWVFPDYQNDEGEAAGAQPGAAAAGKRTLWGVPLREIQSGPARYLEFAEAPMAGYDSRASIDNYPYWPDPARFDYDASFERAQEAAEDFAVIGPWVSCFEIYCQLRGMDWAFMDLIENPHLVEAALDRIESIQTEVMRRFFDRTAPHVDFVFISDDLASQMSLLMSPGHWETHLRPRLERWCEFIHARGVRVFYHTDGAAGRLIEPLIECGIDVLNPIQHACPGMDMTELKRRFGDRVIFHGGVDNQTVLSRGSPQDVRRETRTCLETLGAGREGFICCSCHNVQAGTPLENIFAMVETVHRHG